MKLPKIKAKDIKSAVEWLRAEDMGCYHFFLTATNKWNMYICIGWHDYGDDYRIASKIGIQSFNNIMSCDLDVDFDMPYDEITGDVYDTLEEIGEKPKYGELAKHLNRLAREVVEFQLDYEKNN